MKSLPKVFFVTGTDTAVGKTLVCATLLAGLKAAYWKPIQSGRQPQTDTQWIRTVTALDASHFFPEQYLFSTPLSPHAAAAQDGLKIELDYFKLPDCRHFPHLIVEGAGGLMVPLNERYLMIDLIQHLNLPVLLVARSSLGTINHTLLSLAQLYSRGLSVLGVVLNGPANASNRQAIEHWGQVPVLAEIEPVAHIGRQTLSEIFAERFKVEHARVNSQERLPDLASLHADENCAEAAECGARARSHPGD